MFISRLNIGYNGNHQVWEIGTCGVVALTPVNPFLGDSYKYKFGGKEYQDEFDINSYDFGARNYDPALGRWMNIDPLAELSRKFSPYAYALDNPVYFIDPDGRFALSSGLGLGTSDSFQDFGAGNESGKLKSSSEGGSEGSGGSSNNSAAYKSYFKAGAEKVANTDYSLSGDNGYDTEGNKVSDKGGNEVDYLYDKEGNEIGSTKVSFRGISGGELSKGNFIQNPPKEGQFEYEGYGVRGWSLASGAITPDNTFFEMYVGGKTVGAIFNIAKVPLFKALGQGIKTYVPKLGANRYLRIGTSTSHGREVFRITWRERAKHLLDIDLGKIPKIKK